MSAYEALAEKARAALAGRDGWAYDDLVADLHAACDPQIILSLIEAAERGERAVALLSELVDDDECQLDHHGFCQTHGNGSPCTIARARVLLAATPAESPR